MHSSSTQCLNPTEHRNYHGTHNSVSARSLRHGPWNLTRSRTKFAEHGTPNRNTCPCVRYWALHKTTARTRFAPNDAVTHFSDRLLFAAPPLHTHTHPGVRWKNTEVLQNTGALRKKRLTHTAKRDMSKTNARKFAFGCLTFRVDVHTARNAQRTVPPKSPRRG